MNLPLLLIDCKSKLVRRFIDRRRMELAELPPRQDDWIHADAELFRIYGPHGIQSDTGFDPKGAA